MTSNQLRSETISREELQRSLRLLDAISSWHLWSSALVILLLPVAVVALSFPSRFAQPGLFHRLEASLLIRVLLGMMWIMSGVTLYQQRRRIELFRTGLVEQMDAATKTRVTAEKFYGLSILDPLTGLYNRRFGETRLEEEIMRAEESDEPLLLIALDFDRFKEINDRHGHAAGDLALREFSRRLQRAIRACDVPIRVGGDEFLVIFPQCPPDKIRVILSRMDSLVFTHGGKRISVSFSHGLAQYQVNDTPATMIKRADERLYAEKAKRKAVVPADQACTTESETHTKDSEYADEPSVSERVRPERVRRSRRFSKEIAVLLVGSDLEGIIFTEKTHTVEVSQHGAGVVSRYKLAPGQEMILRCLDTNKEAEVRIECVIRSQNERYTYGLTFVNSDTNIWGIEFPPLTESEKEAGQFLFECSLCKARETLDKSELESDGSAVTKTLVQSCKRCGSATTWNRVLSDAFPTSATEKPQVLAEHR